MGSIYFAVHAPSNLELFEKESKYTAGVYIIYVGKWIFATTELQINEAQSEGGSRNKRIIIVEGSVEQLELEAR